jgi:poly(3-hydroxybutyrate) depolymerase
MPAPRPPAPGTPDVLRARVTVLAIGLLLVFVLFAPAARAKDDEAKAKAEVATELGAYAKWCTDNGAKTEAEAVVAEAEALDAADAVAGAKDALAALSEDAADAKTKVEAQRKVVGPKLAKAYERLARAAAAPGPRGDACLAATLRWEPGKARVGKVLAAAMAAAKDKRLDGMARLLAAVRKADPDGASRYDKLEADLATKGPILVASADHPLLAWLSLPGDWQKGKTYPVLVGVEGAGSNFAGYMNGARGARGSRAVIVVVPCGFTNTNKLEPKTYPYYDPKVLETYDARRMDFDGAGMEKILELVHARFGGEEKVFLTGFSGGGNYTYWKLFTDPAHVRGAAPACANYSAYGITTTPGGGDDGGPVVKLMTGAKDPHKDDVFGQKPGIEGQTDAAQARLKELGYTHVTRGQLPVGHDSLLGEVWKFVDEVLGKK